MPNVRRLYLYVVTFISLEVVIWASIGLLRSITTRDGMGDGFEKLAGALSLVLVGAPIFLIHWGLVQRSARQGIDERSSRIRAIFTYLTLLATLIPVSLGILAMLNHWGLLILGLPEFLAMFGGEQTASDNLIAIAVNLLVAAYFFFILRNDWQAGPSGVAFPEVRRLYRHLWLLYSLLLVIFGIQQTIQFALEAWNAQQELARPLLANGLALLIVGLPVWLLTEWLIRRSLIEAGERDSLLRLAVLYLVIFLSAASLLISTAVVLYRAFGLLWEPLKPSVFLIEIAGPLSLAVPLALSWVYYGRSLKREITIQPAVSMGNVETIPLTLAEADRQRRAGLRRFYGYGLAFLGLAATFIGVQLLLSFVLDLAFKTSGLGLSAMHNRFSAALAALVVGLPLWLVTWRPLRIEAAQEGEAGDHARRSLVRKSYLYLVSFAGIMGIMFGTGMLFYHIIRALLGNAPEDFTLLIFQQIKTVLLFVALFTYHWMALRADGRMAERSLKRRYAQYPVLVLAPDDSDFGEAVLQALQRSVPGIPVAVHPISQGAPDETLSAACVVILPAELVARPGEALRLWLQGYHGHRLVLPTPTRDWFWLGMRSRSLPSLARQAAQVTRNLAEGQEIMPSREVTPIMILGLVLLGLFILLIILVGITSGINLLVD